VVMAELLLTFFLLKWLIPIQTIICVALPDSNVNFYACYDGRV
jgi:hypothetical protein